MIVVPIAIAWFQIHVSSSTTKGVQSNFQPINEVRATGIFCFFFTAFCFCSFSVQQHLSIMCREPYFKFECEKRRS